MLFVVPSEALVRYVSSVLPALGVTGVAVTTYAGLGTHDPAEAHARVARQVHRAARPTRWSRLKKHPALLPLCEDVVRDRASAIEVELEAALAGVEGGAAVLGRYRELAGAALVPRLRRVYRWVSTRPETTLPPATRVRAESTLKALGARADDILSAWGDLMTDRARLTAGLVERGMATAREVESLVTWCTGQLADPPRAAGRLGGALDRVGRRPRGQRGRAPAGRMDEEDDAVLLRLIQIERGGLSARGIDPIEYQHVAIDEAQDRSAVEVKVLVEATHAEGGDPDARSVTIAGDTAQRLVFDNHFLGWRELHRGGRATPAAVLRPLRLSYRSTAEVMQLARYILGPELAPEEPLYARSGAPVEVHEFGGVGEAVGFLGDALRGLACARADRVGRGDRALPRAGRHLLRRPACARRCPPSVACGAVTSASSPASTSPTSAQVKGLEFDYVVMVDVNASTYPDAVESRHLLHIGATRAAYQLWMVVTSAPSPLLPPQE